MIEPTGIRITTDLAGLDSWLHRRDPRALILLVVGFAVAVMSLHPLQVDRSVLMVAFPLFLTLSAGLPLALLIRRAAWSLPFSVMLGAAAVLADRVPVPFVPGWMVSRGILTALTLVIRTYAMVWMALLLVGVASVTGLCMGVRRLGVPAVLVESVYFVIRYLGELGERSTRMQRAYRVRSGGHSRIPPLMAASLAGHLLSATIAKGRRVAMALEAREFSGLWRHAAHRSFRPADGWMVGIGWLLMAVSVLDWTAVWMRITGGML